MSREVHVRVCEGLRGKFPRSTRLQSLRKLLIFYDIVNNLRLVEDFLVNAGNTKGEFKFLKRLL